MSTDEITIRVDSALADVYRAASAEDRNKIDLLLSLRLDEVTRPTASLEEIMQEATRQAQERGLTPEILDAILNDG